MKPEERAWMYGHWSTADLALKGFWEKLRRAVNANCCCGGKGPEDPGVCDVCLVWHQMRK